VTLADLNSLPSSEACAALLRCCGSQRWAEQMSGARGFTSLDDLLRQAELTADQLTDEDWLEAFAAHPRIGQRTTSEWSQTEQAAALNAEEDMQQKLQRANAEYEARFGFIFIVFARGKTPEQILELLQRRMNNDRATEIANAAAEQRRITRSRLHRLVET
jgi:OHCU decarboxylase